jgi:hypothetical protein
MIEQQVADRFQEAVANEPPLGFDPDDVIDRAIKRSRRRKVVWAVAAATVVEAAVVWAIPGGGSGGGAIEPAARPTPPPGQQTITLTGFEEALSSSRPLLLPRVDPPELMIRQIVVRNPAMDDGSIQLKRGNEVLEEISLHRMTEYTTGDDTKPLMVPGGEAVTLTVNCTGSANACQSVTVTVSGTIVERHG